MGSKSSELKVLFSTSFHSLVFSKLAPFLSQKIKINVTWLNSWVGGKHGGTCALRRRLETRDEYNYFPFTKVPKSQSPKKPSEQELLDYIT